MLAEIIRLHVDLDEEQQAKFDAALRAEENKEVREMVVTWEEHLAASKAEGKAEGEAEGLLTAMRNSILRAVWPRAESHLYSEPKLVEKRGFVESRFSELPPERRESYDRSGRNSKVLIKELAQAGE